MSSWRQAHQLANLAAAQAHADLKVDPAAFPVDVYGAIERAGVLLIWRPLPKAFGMYVCAPRSRPGILINNRLEGAVQRHTAAHELGHHYLGHGSRVDIDLDPFAASKRGWTDVEKAAEAFAVWFLMPRRCVRAALGLMRLDRPRSPGDVYQLSLLLGTSYRSTARHLVNLRLASDPQARSWMAVQPSRIKQQIDPGEVPASRAPHVWKVGRTYRSIVLAVNAGDRIVIDVDGIPPRITLSGEATLISAAGSSGAVVIEVDPAACGLIEIGVGPSDHADSWALKAMPLQPRSGIRSRYPEMCGTSNISGAEDEECGL